MATYIPNITDVFPEPYIYKPDLAFYDKMLQRKTALYEQGISKARSLWESVLNAPLSNKYNIPIRDQYIKQARENLQKMAGADFSQPQTIASARGIFAPFWEDKFIVRDSELTRAYQNEAQILEGWKNSSDPKVRENYNGIAAVYLNNGLQKLVDAERTDEGFSNIEKRKAVPFTNIQKYLEEQAGKDPEKLKIIWDESSPDGAYMIKTTNGERSAKHFREWALSQIGNNFYEQFNVIGKVEDEERVKYYKTNFPNLTETQIREKIADDVINDIDKGYHSERNSIQSEITRIDGIINAMPKVLTKQEQKLIDQYEYEKAQLKGKLDETDYKYNVNNSAKSKEILRQNIITNPQTYFSLKAKDNLVSNWAKGRASITSKEVRENTIFSNAEKNYRTDRQFQLELEKENRLRQEGLWKREKDLYEMTQEGDKPKRERGTRYDAAGNKVDDKGNIVTEPIEGVDPTTGIIYKGIGTRDVSKEGNALEIFNRDQNKTYQSAFGLVFNKDGLFYFAQKGLGLTQSDIMHIESALDRDVQDPSYKFTPEQRAASIKLEKALEESQYVKNSGIKITGPSTMRDALYAYAQGYINDRFEKNKKDGVDFSFDENEVIALQNYSLAMQNLRRYNANEENRKKLIDLELQKIDPKTNQPVYSKISKKENNKILLVEKSDILKNLPKELQNYKWTLKNFETGDVVQVPMEKVVQSYMLGKLTLPYDNAGNLREDIGTFSIDGVTYMQVPDVAATGPFAAFRNEYKYRLPAEFNKHIVTKYGKPDEFGKEYNRLLNNVVPNLLFYESRTAKQGVEFYGKFSEKPNDKMFLTFNEALSSANADMYIEKNGKLEIPDAPTQAKIKGLLENKEKSVEKLVEGFSYTTVSGEQTGSKPYISFSISSAALTKEEKENLGFDLAGTTIKLVINDANTGKNLSQLPKNSGYYIYQELLRGQEIKSDPLMEKTGYKFTLTPNKDGKTESPTVATLNMEFYTRKNVKDPVTGKLTSILDPQTFKISYDLTEKTPDEIMHEIYNQYYNNLQYNRNLQLQYEEYLKNEKNRQSTNPSSDGTQELVDKDQYLRKKGYK